MPASSRIRPLPVRFSRHAATLCACLALLLALCPRANCQESAAANEDALRAAMLFNITRFVEWPGRRQDTDRSPLILCVLGADPISPNLEKIVQSQSTGARIVQLRQIASPDQASACNVLYVSLGQRKRVESALFNLAGSGVLTVSENSNAKTPAQVIGLPIVDDHIHIEVNLAQAQKSGFVISSKLLRLATVNH